MCSLRDFTEFGNHSHNLTDNNTSMGIVIKRIKPETIKYPNIVIQLQNKDQESLFLPSSGPTLLQNIISKFDEEGIWFVCEEITKYLKTNQSIISVFVYPLKFIMKFSPCASLKDSENWILSDINRTKLWSSSVVRCMAWHPHTFKLAIASSHDILYVFNQEGTKAILNKTSQCAILSMAWRPLSTGILAVGCEKGIFIWNIEFSHLHIKPIVNNHCRLIKEDHRYITGLSWNKMGDLLLSCAITSNTMYIWNYPLKTCVPLHRISSSTLNFVLWSPDNSRVFSCSTNETFRIWSTDKWTSDKWLLNNRSKVQCACWSSCSSILLFATDLLPIINAIDFRKSDVFNETNYEKVAWPIIDLKSENINNKIFGGQPLNMSWDSFSKRLAITFKNIDLLAIFQTNIGLTTVDCIPFCIIEGHLDEVPSTIAFQPTCKQGSLLTIGWSNGNIEYIPFAFNFKPKHQYQQNDISYINIKSDNISRKSN